MSDLNSSSPFPFDPSLDGDGLSSDGGSEVRSRSGDGEGRQADDNVEQARRLVAAGRRIVVLTGAGISTDSRIPDFRGPQGIWTKNPGAEKAATIHNYVANAEIRRAAWLTRLDSPMWAAEPNPGHRALLELEKRGTLHMLITQNVDGLHQLAGTSPDRVVEVHGTAREATCLSCEYRAPMQDVLDRVRRGEQDPDCPICGGILKSATVSFGQNLRVEDVERATAAAEECDVLLAVGSTLSVYPIAGVVPVAKQAGASIVIVNGTPTELDYLADVVVRGSISDVLPRIMS